MKVRSSLSLNRRYYRQCMVLVGTLLASRGLNTTASDVKQHILRFNSPPVVAEDVLEQAIQQVMEFYPDIPSLGSPFNTGDELFGLTSSYKRHAAIRLFSL